MIVVDTNVISELWKIEPDSNLLGWIDAQMVETLYLSTITIAELRFGLASISDDKRATIYKDRLEREVLPAFTGRILSFDQDASQAYAQLMARARSAGYMPIFQVFIDTSFGHVAGKDMLTFKLARRGRHEAA